MIDLVGGISAVAAIASAVAAFMSYRVSNQAAAEIKRAGEEAKLEHRRIALERLVIAAESLLADRARGDHLADRVLRTNGFAAMAVGGFGSSRQKLAETACEGYRRDIFELSTCAAPFVEKWADGFSSLSTAAVADHRLNVLQAQEKVAVLLEKLEIQLADAEKSIDASRALKSDTDCFSRVIPER